MASIVKFIFYVGCLFFICYLTWNRIKIQRSAKIEIVSPVALYPYEIEEVNAPTPVDNRLQMGIENALSGTKGTYGIVVKSLSDDTNFAIQEHRLFESASLYKLWVMAVAYNLIEEGKLKENELLQKNISYLDEKFKLPTITPAAEQEGISLTVQEAMEKMIVVSENYPALLLADRINLANVTKLFKNFGFTESNVGQPPKTSAYDTALFLEILYKGGFAGPNNTEKMLSLLKKQALNNKLPKYLPEGTTIAHKTGELDSFSHDAGIVYTDKGNYIIAVLSESEDPKLANERIANISKVVWEYFNNK